MDDCTLVLAAFDRESGLLRGFAVLLDRAKYMSFSILRVYPESEKQAINAAIVAEVCEYCNKCIAEGIYVVDGERNVLHQTGFQDYLVKYFGFRKAYCRLNIQYRKAMAFLIKFLYPFRNIVKLLCFIPIVQSVSSVLVMEEIVREQECIDKSTFGKQI